jgi:hypothetical protein
MSIMGDKWIKFGIRGARVEKVWHNLGLVGRIENS